MIGTVLVCIFGLLIGVAAFRYRFRSTPTHLVVQRRTPALPPTPAEQHHMDVHETRRLEWDIYGRYYTGLDGRPIQDEDPAATVKDDPKPEGTPCWCNYCQGRVGVHGEDAVALYKEQARAAFARATPSQRITQTMVGGSVTQIQAGRSRVIAGDASGIIVTGDNVVVSQGHADEPDWDELGRNMDRLGYDLSRAIDRATRGIFG